MYLKDFKDKKNQINKKVLLSYKKVDFCEHCGIKDENKSIFVLHHREGTDKKFEFRKLGKRLYTLNDLTKEIKDELDKCSVLCRNCHTLAHCNLDKFELYKKDIYNKIDSYKDQARLDPETIKKLYIPRVITMKQLAVQFNTSISSISYVINHR